MTSLTGAGRPSSSQQQAMGATNWAAQQQQQQQLAQAQQGAQGGLGANSNTLSYGSLKNRFLSGASKNNGAPAAANGAPHASSGASGKGGSSKLFSLAR